MGSLPDSEIADVKARLGCSRPVLIVTSECPHGKWLRCGSSRCPGKCGEIWKAETSLRSSVGLVDVADSVQDDVYWATFTMNPAVVEAIGKDDQSALWRELALAWRAFLRVRHGWGKRSGRRFQFISWKESKLGRPHLHFLCIGNPFPIYVQHANRDLRPREVKAHRRLAKERGQWLQQFGFAGPGGGPIGFVHDLVRIPKADVRNLVTYALKEYVQKDEGEGSKHWAIPKGLHKSTASPKVRPSQLLWRLMREIKLRMHPESPGEVIGAVVNARTGTPVPVSWEHPGWWLNVSREMVEAMEHWVRASRRRAGWSPDRVRSTSQENWAELGRPMGGRFVAQLGAPT